MVDKVLDFLAGFIIGTMSFGYIWLLFYVFGFMLVITIFLLIFIFLWAMTRIGSR